MFSAVSIIVIVLIGFLVVATNIAQSLGFIVFMVTSILTYKIFFKNIEEFKTHFGNRPVPDNVISEALKSLYDDGERSYVLRELAKLKGKEIRTWIEPMLTSKDSIKRGYGAIAMLYIDEAKGLELCKQYYEDIVNGTIDYNENFTVTCFLDELREFGTKGSNDLCEEIARRSNKEYEDSLLKT